MASGHKQISSDASKSKMRRNPSPHVRKKVLSFHVTGITIESTDFGKTPVNRKPDENTKRKEYTSTPAVDITSFPVCDASAIADQSYMPTMKAPIESTGVRRKQNYKVTSRERIQNVTNASVVALPGKQKSKDSKGELKLMEEEVDLLYTRYLQALFLESRAKKSLEMRTDDAAEKLHKLCIANQILLRQQKTLQQELDNVRYVKQMMQHCQNQRKMLEPMHDVIPRIMRQYEDIAAAVESIRHKLYTPSVSFPPGSNCEGELLDLARQWESLSRTFLETFSPEQRRMAEVSELLLKLTSLMGKLSNEIRRCSKLLSSADHLVTSETSLKITEFECKGRKDTLII